MKGDEKIIRIWRMQLAKPFGVHLWFDPSVESVRLLSEPTDFVCISERDTKKVDKPVQLSILGESSSVSGQAGGAEGDDQDNSKLDGIPDRDPVVPF